MGKTYSKQSPVTRGRYISYLKTLFQFGVKQDLIEKNPATQRKEAIYRRSVSSWGTP